jgi:hypothetical protein
MHAHQTVDPHPCKQRLALADLNTPVQQVASNTSGHTMSMHDTPNNCAGEAEARSYTVGLVMVEQEGAF